GAPLRELHFVEAGRPRQHVTSGERFELAGPAQVGGNDGGNVLRRRGVAADPERHHSDGNGGLGGAGDLDGDRLRCCRSHAGDGDEQHQDEQAFRRLFQHYSLGLKMNWTPWLAKALATSGSLGIGSGLAFWMVASARRSKDGSPLERTVRTPSTVPLSASRISTSVSRPL